MRLALLDHWSVEIAHLRDDNAVGKLIASEGIEAGKQAVALQPNSAEAHALLGRLYGEIIPFTFMGGIRFGRKSTDEVLKALTLDPQSVEAHIGLGINKIFTPTTFGGSLPEAIELLKKAVELDPASDTARLAGTSVRDRASIRRCAARPGRSCASTRNACGCIISRPNEALERNDNP